MKSLTERAEDAARSRDYSVLGVILCMVLTALCVPLSTALAVGFAGGALSSVALWAGFGAEHHVFAQLARLEEGNITLLLGAEDLLLDEDKPDEVVLDFEHTPLNVLLADNKFARTSLEKAGVSDTESAILWARHADYKGMVSSMRRARNTIRAYERSL